MYARAPLLCSRKPLANVKSVRRVDGEGDDDKWPISPAERVHRRTRDDTRENSRNGSTRMSTKSSLSLSFSPIRDSRSSLASTGYIGEDDAPLS
jgi:hypothetical protein